ncbi:MAG: DUF6994 family protein [Candidatus Avigastranaerophilus sp.]
MNKIIDVTFDFTTDTPNYWETFKSGSSEADPDIWSPKMREYQQLLYRRVLPNGEMFDLKVGDNPEYNYLYWKDFRFGSDSIINMYVHHKSLQWLIANVKNELSNFNELHEKYIREGYTIGGEIIFPKRTWSINRMRGTNAQIKDRFDLTLECIRRYYNSEQSPLYKVLKEDEKFFGLFVDFKGYVNFFYLNDLVSDDYKSVKFFLDFDNFKENPRPQTVEEWRILYDKQMEFLRKRNLRIDKSFNKYYQ